MRLSGLIKVRSPADERKGMIEIFREDTFFGTRNENKRKVWMRFGNLAELGDEMLTDATSA